VQKNKIQTKSAADKIRRAFRFLFAATAIDCDLVASFDEQRQWMTPLAGG
jgi:hypothetical protein